MLKISVNGLTEKIMGTNYNVNISSKGGKQGLIRIFFISPISKVVFPKMNSQALKNTGTLHPLSQAVLH